ncbi:MAG TPA: ferritin family protein [Bacteroidales bacterium]|nr:ferritin family protein [Bacteroidales bacterium]HQI71010.1 ferritin family protein [Bacteroidales bacterium]
MFDSSHFHPMIVHFPVALIMIGFLADVLSLFFNKKEPCLSKAGFYLMILGTLGAFAAYFTGEFFTRELTGEAGELKERHEIFAKITMFVMLAACLLRIYLVWKKKINSGFKWLVFFLYLIATCTVGYTGLLGGTLVYNHMIGLESASVEQTVVVTNKTVENLKTALQGETTASAKYAAFAQKADGEGLPQIAALFRAASKAESVHAGNHRNILGTLGHKVDVQPETFTVNNTLENLQAAYDGEKHETESMYPVFIEQATTDNNSDAVKSFGWATDTETKHMELYQAAVDALKSKKEKSLPDEYYVCPKCGFTYSHEDIEDYCGLCGTEKAKFFTFK